MATAVVMPKQGQSVESCIIVEWKKQPGEPVEEGDVLCEVETDKAVVEVPSPVAGTLLAHFFAAGDEVPVMTTIAAVGEPGESVDALRPAGATSAHVGDPSTPVTSHQSPVSSHAASGVSPRARKLAAQRNIDPSGLEGSGPGGRILERDVMTALAAQPKLSPVARAMVEQGGYAAPAQGSGPGGRVMARDLTGEAGPLPTAAVPVQPMPEGQDEGEVEVIPVKGVRRVIAERMLASLQTTAQLTLHASADARALLALRKRFKASDPALGLQGVTVNDLVLYAVTRVLPLHPPLNAHFADGAIRQYQEVHLGFAVDTPRGLLVPVVRRAQTLSLRRLAEESKRLAAAAQNGSATPDELTGGTFTVTNLGQLGIEQFTPILYAPQVAILGVGSVNLKPVGDGESDVTFVPHIALSLTINHQAVDGAPGARFLQGISQGLANIELLLAF
jgi:pyruvate dehydrogenase E2 component (dihydrolipoamide acetyltransferase)